MPALVWLGNLLLTVVTSAVSFFGLQLAKKTIYLATALAAFLAMTVTFVGVVHALLSAIVYAMPSSMAEGADLILPSNFSACIGSLIAAKIARWIYDYHVESLRIAASVT
ncbi:conserved membrane protein of unknown function [Georgfuchsia toluolica]|uniref:Uncharacterized protein n=1 Tax=Georgfuchsia toluolica TaxID=424218 RepID=A0A916J374_9PROT|nr:DUF5455 family protein [Georgfuchsia toluolica]CAG4883762.1 conserved membrane protein of unknown function [Georgfuchsia toluolica]